MIIIVVINYVFQLNNFINRVIIKIFVSLTFMRRSSDDKMANLNK